MNDKLSSLRDPLDSLSREQLLERLALVRDDRKISKYAITQRVARADKKKKTVSSKLKGLFAGMDKTELDALILELGDEE